MSSAQAAELSGKATVKGNPSGNNAFGDLGSSICQFLETSGSLSALGKQALIRPMVFAQGICQGLPGSPGAAPL